MGIFNYRFRVYSSDRKEYVDIDALVDTGALYTWLPAPLLQKLGYRPSDVRRFETADGKIIERSIGAVVVALNGKSLPTVTVFATTEDKVLLGAVTLEQFALAPDPIHRKLVPIIPTV